MTCRHFVNSEDFIYVKSRNLGCKVLRDSLSATFPNVETLLHVHNLTHITRKRQEITDQHYEIHVFLKIQLNAKCLIT
jgi:hypothetical protein